MDKTKKRNFRPRNSYNIKDLSGRIVATGRKAYSDKQAVGFYVKETGVGSSLDFVAELKYEAPCNKKSKEIISLEIEESMESGQCPHCNYVDPAQADTCPNCGLVKETADSEEEIMA